MPYQSIADKVLSRIRGTGRGYVFTPSDFLDIGSRGSVDQSLSRLAKTGEIRRLARGLYDFPRISPRLGVLAPAPSEVAKAVERKTGASVRTSGAQAANLLGLSMQVPARQVYETTGRTGRLRVQGSQVEFRHRSARIIAGPAGVADEVVRALMHLGAGGVTDADIRRLAKTLTSKDKNAIKRKIKRAPSWLHPVLRRLVESQ
jgi:hypothetical protein